jgi:glucosamine-6-phosphate deaminase
MTMQIHILENADALGQAAAVQAAAVLNQSIAEKGSARLLLSTGMSQFEILDALTRQAVPWGQVDLFHLDEYIGLPVSHPASFRKYLQEHFIGRVSLRSACLIDGEGDIDAEIRRLGDLIREAPVDLGLIGIGENSHIAFNDPPADFTVDDPYIVVRLDEACKRQQVGEGWFPVLANVPERAISMSVRQILRCKRILSCVPHAAKAHAVRLALQDEVSPLVPASILKTHPAIDLYLDVNSAAELNPDRLIDQQNISMT